MTQKNNASWRTYEEVAAYVLNQCASQFGLARFEGKQGIAGQSGTDWEVDARGWAEDGKTFVVVECKKHKGAKISQAIVGSLAFTIQDTGAAGGFLVSPHGLQAGAKKVAAAAKVEEIKLDPASTPDAFFGEWLGSLQAGFADTVTASMSEHVQFKLFNAEGKLIQEYDSNQDLATQAQPGSAPPPSSD